MGEKVGLSFTAGRVWVVECKVVSEFRDRRSMSHR